MESDPFCIRAKAWHMNFAVRKAFLTLGINIKKGARDAPNFKTPAFSALPWNFWHWLFDIFRPAYKTVSLLPGVFELSYLENHGAAFGILKGQKAFLILMTGITLTVLIFLYFRILGEQRYGCIRLMLAFLISGAIGNFIDRCFHDYVIDFFYFCLIDFPVFNVADIYVTVSVILLFLLFGFYYKEEDLDHLLHLLQFWKKRKTQE